MYNNTKSCSSIVGGQVYRATDSPQYIRAHSACAALMFFQVCVVLLFKFALKRINKKRDNMTPEERRAASEGEELCDAVSLYLNRINIYEPSSFIVNSLIL